MKTIKELEIWLKYQLLDSETELKEAGKEGWINTHSGGVYVGIVEALNNVKWFLDGTLEKEDCEWKV